MDVKTAAQRWIDDYLDLLNFAKQIGDTAWQSEILQTLKEKDIHINRNIRNAVNKELWSRFDSINQKMMELFELLKESQDSDEITSIRELMWELKLKRIELARKLRA